MPVYFSATPTSGAAYAERRFAVACAPTFQVAASGYVIALITKRRSNQAVPVLFPKKRIGFLKH